MNLTSRDFPCPRCKAEKDDPCVTIRRPIGVPLSKVHEERTALVPPSPIEHGTYAGYQRHTRLKDTPCDPCRGAAATYMAQYRHARPADYAHEKQMTAARGRALWRLSRAHPEEFRAYVIEEST